MKSFEPQAGAGEVVDLVEKNRDGGVNGCAVARSGQVWKGRSVLHCEDVTVKQ